jgi:hypothetical protein
MIFLVAPICTALIMSAAFAAICRYALARSWTVSLLSGFGLFALALAVVFFVTPHGMR